MQYVRYDMDDLFRKAGEGYPLDTSGADWEKIAKQLHPTEQKEPEPVKGGSRKFLLLLLLLPLGLICTRNFISDKGKPASAYHAEKKETDKNNIGENKVVKAGDAKENEIESSSYLKEENSLFSHASSGTVGKSGKTKGNKGASAKSQYSGNTEQGEASQFENQLIRRGSAGQNRNRENASQDLEQPVDSRQTYFSAKEYASLSISPLSPSHQNIAAISSGKKPDYQKQKRFYAGLFGALDATTVEFQKVENAGHDYGLLVGYQFSKKWSVEAGLFIDKKFYYSKGDYLNTRKISYQPPNSKITDVWGDCKMFELPLSVKYDISSSAGSSWFSTLGLSSYIMKKENYDYNYYYGNSGTSAIHSYTYKNASRNLFSVMQVSAGYSRTMVKCVSLRIEPYIKLPVSGIGFGELRLLSTGLRVGVTKKLF